MKVSLKCNTFLLALTSVYCMVIYIVYCIKVFKCRDIIFLSHRPTPISGRDALFQEHNTINDHKKSCLCRLPPPEWNLLNIQGII